MSTLNMEEVDRLFDLFMPRITEAISLENENGSAERAAAAIHSLLMTAATVLVADEGIGREPASVLIPEMIAAAYQAMSETLSVMHLDN